MSFERPIQLYREGIGNINYQEPPGAGSGFVNIAGARNGLTIDSNNFVVLGQSVGQSGAPGKLLSSREIPFAGFNLQLGTDSTGRLLLRPRDVAIRDSGNLTVVEFLPTRNSTLVGVPGQFFSNLGISNEVDYNNAAATGLVNDFASVSSIFMTAGAVSSAAFVAKQAVQNSGGSGDAISFLSIPFFQNTGTTGNLRGFYHAPTGAVHLAGGKEIAFENVSGDIYLNSTSGKTGIQQNTTPTAYVHIGASDGNAGNAPLKLTAGSLTVTPESGAIEFDGTSFYVTAGATRTAFAPLIFASGLTQTGSTVTNDLITGKGSAQTITGGTTAAGQLHFTSTTNATKGPITIGSTISFAESNGAINTSGNISMTGATAQLSISASNGSLGTPVMKLGAQNAAIWTATTALRFGASTSSQDVFISHSAAGPNLTISAATSPTLNGMLNIADAASGAAGSNPIGLTAGTLLTTPANGAIEYNGTNLFFTRTAATRESIFTGVSGAAAPATSVGVAIVNFYGSSATNFLGTPNSWASVVIAGTVFKIPLYT